jgi:hypothetical protein
VEYLAAQFETLLSFGEDDGWSDLMDQAFHTAAEAIARESEKSGIPLKDLYTTLILVVARPDMVVSAQIGDGVVIVSDHDSNLFALTAPQHGEYRNDTIFLNSKQAQEQTQVYLWPGSPANVALLTDGLELLALNLRDGTPFVPFFAPLWRFARTIPTDGADPNPLATFLTSPRIASRTDDDLTLVLGALMEDMA